MPEPKAPSPPPKRPRSFEAVGFEREKFVRWFNPQELVRTGFQAFLSDVFGAFADKREVQAALQFSTEEAQRRYESESPDADFWFDFVADVGDGFNATYSIALLLAQESLELPRADGPAVSTQRGRLLLMGGDEVYPAASRKDYINRTTGPYRAAFPYIENEENAPHLYALPGNHDWYDGLSAFLRQFTQKGGRWVGGWRTQQRRSYFARKLPRGIWLWGIDIQLHADIDSPQLEYFERAAALLQAGDRVLLATAEPSWVKEAEGERGGYNTLLLVMGKIPAHARVVMLLTGDSHHYARYVDDAGVHFVTAGGGGAFLHGTHTLPERIGLPIGTDAADAASERLLTRRTIFPTASDSRSLVRRAIWRFPCINWAFSFTWLGLWLYLGFSLNAEDPRFISRLARTLEGAAVAAHERRLFVLLAVVAVVFVVRLKLPIPDVVRPAFPYRGSTRGAPAGPRSSRRAPNRVLSNWRKAVDVTLWLVILAGAVLVAAAGEPSALGTLQGALARSANATLIVLLVPILSGLYVSRPLAWTGPYRATAPWLGRWLLGTCHGALYVLSWLLLATVTAKWSENPFVWLASSSVLAALVSTLLFAGALWFGGQHQRALLNDAFSAIGVEDYKNFLRLRIAPDGTLTVYAVGLLEVGKEWRINPDDAPPPGAPFIVLKEGKLEPHLIEKFEVPPSAPTALPSQV